MRLEEEIVAGLYIFTRLSYCFLDFISNGSLHRGLGHLIIPNSSLYFTSFPQLPHCNAFSNLFTAFANLSTSLIEILVADILLCDSKFAITGPDSRLQSIICLFKKLP